MTGTSGQSPPGSRIEDVDFFGWKYDIQNLTFRRLARQPEYESRLTRCGQTSMHQGF